MVSGNVRHFLVLILLEVSVTLSPHYARQACVARSVWVCFLFLTSINGCFMVSKK